MTMRRLQALLLVGASMLAGCALDPLHARRAAATASAAQDRTSTCDAPDACAIASPYASLTERALRESTPSQPTHFIGLLDRGEEALLLRVHLIRAAKHSIDLQTFRLAADDAGYLVLDELVKAARRGVKVRVLSDQLFSLDDVEVLATLARAHVNFEWRVYNPTFNSANTPPLEFAAGIVCCFIRFNQRMHDKLLLIDEAVGVVGGRNYEDRYYDWDPEFNYRDRDTVVVGPQAAAQMRASFEQFWQHDRTAPLSSLRDVAARILRDGADAKGYALHEYAKPERVANLSRRADDVAYIAAHFTNAALRVGQVDYFSDLPEKHSEPTAPAENALTDRIIGLVRNAKSEIVAQTPYLVLSDKARTVFSDLHKARPGVRIIVSTNSLASTDAFMVYAISYKYKKRYLKLGFEIHEYKPFPADAADLIEGYASLAPPGATRADYQRFGKAPLTTAGVRVGLHAKSMVIDGEWSLIGSHNFDPRSLRYNTESGIIVHDATFARMLRESILRDTEPSNAWTIAKRQQVRFLGRINNAIGDISAALPIFDFWPFRYAVSFELDPGCTPLPPGDPHFYECYTDVGDFPEVNLPLKTIYTRIVTAFGAGLVSIM